MTKSRTATPSNAGAPPAVNPDLKQLHTTLVELVAKLNATIAQATTAAQVIAITDEIAEVNARVVSAGRQLLTQQTAAITRNADAVAKAVPEVEAAIAKFDDLRALVGGLTKFLSVVDKAIDVAKLVV